MTFVEAQEYKTRAGTQPAFVLYQSKWNEVRLGIEPHYNGVLPQKLLSAFPNETNTAQHYRTQNYNSVVKGRLGAAVRDVGRLCVGGQYTIAQGEKMREWLKEFWELNGMDFIPYLFEIVYPKRVTDPNAMLAVMPKFLNADGELIQYAATDKIPTHIQLFGSAQITTWLPRLITVEYAPLCEYWFTPDAFFIVKQGVLMAELLHENNDLGVYPLGGNKEFDTSNVRLNRIIEYYKSDFDFAITAMDKVARNQTQQDALTLTSAFPTKVVRGLTCPSCNGRGMDDAGHACQSCNGTGVIAPRGALEQIVVSPLPPDMNVANPMGIDEMLQYIAPPAHAYEQINHTYSQALQELDIALNISLATNTAASGASKDADRENAFLFLQKVSTGMQKLATSVLQAVVRYLTHTDKTQTQAELAALVVTPPSKFSLNSVDELVTRATTNVAAKPITLRYFDRLELYKRSFGIGSMEEQALMIAFEATMGKCLLTLDELVAMQATDFSVLLIETTVLNELKNGTALDLIKQKAAKMAGI